jgi:hypothetical protein
MNNFELPQGAAIGEQVAAYFAQQGVDISQLMKVDVVLALLRMNTSETLRAAEELSGVKVTKCPPDLRPIPPRASSGVRCCSIARLESRDSLETVSMRRYRLLRVGMTRQQAIARGVTVRDLRYWERRGYLAWTGASSG